MTEQRPSKRKSSRRKVSIDDDSRWVFNRMANAYDARPAYPVELVDSIAELTATVGKHLGDLGAGIGHLAIPLAERGLEVTAIEPARMMLEQLNRNATARGVRVTGIHAAAESLPLVDQSLHAVLIADALHFIDSELAAREIARVLVPRGLLMVVACELGTSTFMREVAHTMQQASQRRPRRMTSRSALLAGVAGIPLDSKRTFQDATPATHAEIDRILASVSFIGPAMNAERRLAFRERIHALAERYPAVWERQFTLHWGMRQLAQASPRPRRVTLNP